MIPVSDPAVQALADAAQAGWQVFANELKSAGFSNEAILKATGKVPAAPLTLRVARSAARVNSDELNEAQLDAGVLYAIFIQDDPTLFIDTIEFLLDGSPVHTEASAPWDYAGTAFDGSATRVTFVPGEYTIQANVTDASGTYAIDATFNVE